MEEKQIPRKSSTLQVQWSLVCLVFDLDACVPLLPIPPSKRPEGERVRPHVETYSRSSRLGGTCSGRQFLQEAHRLPRSRPTALVGNLWKTLLVVDVVGEIGGKQMVQLRERRD